MTCHCGSVALWKVGDHGFCRAHKDQAYQEAQKAKSLQMSVAGLLTLDRERRRSDERDSMTSRHRS